MRRLLALCVLTLAGACEAPGPDGIFSGPVFPSPTNDDPAFRQAVTVGDGPNGAHILYINFDGVTLRRGLDNATTNTSQIANGSVTMPAFNDAPYGPSLDRAGAIDRVMTHLRDFFAAYNAVLVTQRPTSGRYTMCVVGGTPGLLGIGGGAAGVAPLDCDNRVESNVVFAFSDVLRPQQTGSASASLKAVAVTCAQEIAHGFGLGHTRNAEDIMYPQLTNRVKGFGGASQLQNDGSGQCSRGATTQDSHQMLLDVMGPNPDPNGGGGGGTGGGGGAGGGGGGGGGPVTPEVGWVTPKQGATVPPQMITLEVAARAAGDSITRVEVSAGGQVLLEWASPPYRRTVAAQQTGPVELTATAYSASGGSASATVRFTLSQSAPPQETGCTTDSDCNAPLTCQNGGCDFPPPPSTGGACAQPCPPGTACAPDGTCQPEMSGPAPGAIGAACGSHADCTSGLCVEQGDRKYCSAVCYPQAPESCPSGSTCQLTGGTDFLCQPNQARGGPGGCAVGGPPGRPAGAILAACLLLLAFVLRRRAAGAR